MKTRIFLIVAVSFLCLSLMGGCSSDPNAGMAAPSEITLSTTPELGEKAAVLIEVTGNLSSKEKGGLFIVTLNGKAKKEFPQSALYLVLSVKIRRGEEIVGTPDVSYALIQGPLEEGQAFKADFTVPQSGVAGERVVVIDSVTDKAPF